MKVLVQITVLAIFLAFSSAGLTQRHRRDFIFPDEKQRYEVKEENTQDTLVHGQFGGFGEFEPGKNTPNLGNDGLTIPGSGGSAVFQPLNKPPPIGVSRPENGLNIGGDDGLVNGVFTHGFSGNEGSLNSGFVQNNGQSRPNYNPGTVHNHHHNHGHSHNQDYQQGVIHQSRPFGSVQGSFDEPRRSKRSPQENQVWGFGSPPVISTPTSRPVRPLNNEVTTQRSTTAPSQEFLRCLANCPSTNEYNPVCGSDDNEYHNEWRLNCATRCGADVSLWKRGRCRPA